MNHRRTQLPQTTAILGLMLLSLNGCKYDRSFMNMDSNSGSPFFGLQLAVDSGSRPPVDAKSSRSDDRRPHEGHRYPAIPDVSGSADASHPPILLTSSANSKPNGFERTSNAREPKTNVLYSLQAPTTDKSLQTQAIDLRLSAF